MFVMTRHLIARACKVSRFARKLNSAPADLESRPRTPEKIGVRSGVRVRSGVGLVGLGTATVVLCGPAHKEPPYIYRC